jgi:RHS repeat-associated protein
VFGSTTEALFYNAYGELARQVSQFGSSPIADITYDAVGAERDSLGRITQKTEVMPSGTQAFGYTYDPLGRLTDVVVDGVLAEHFDYDQNGNRTAGYQGGAGTSTGAYDDQDRLVSYGPWAFTYTANGDLETKTNTATGDQWLFQYDALGSLLTVALPNGGLIEYLVDGRGRRVGRKKNGVLQKQWLYRGGLNPVAELDGTGAIVAVYGYGSGGSVPAYVQRGTTTYRLISDHLGSPRYAVNVNNSSDVPFTAAYTSFGQATGSGLDWIPFGFAGGIYDVDSGLVRFGARDYDPSIGRWLSKDPSLFSGGVNLYVYSKNDPVNYRDASGRGAWAVAGGIAVVAGIVAWAGIDIYGEGIRQRAQDLADQNFPDRHSGENNFLRHCIASCIAQSDIGGIAGELMNGREYLEQFFGASKSHCDVDRHNNDLGALASQSVNAEPGTEGDSECEDRCFSLWGAGITGARDRG